MQDLGKAGEHWIEKGYEERDTQIALLKTWPEFEDLLSDPRFTTVIKKIGLE